MIGSSFGRVKGTGLWAPPVTMEVSVNLGESQQVYDACCQALINPKPHLCRRPWDKSVARQMPHFRAVLVLNSTGTVDTVFWVGVTSRENSWTWTTAWHRNWVLTSSP